MPCIQGCPGFINSIAGQGAGTRALGSLAPGVRCARANPKAQCGAHLGGLSILGVRGLAAGSTTPEGKTYPFNDGMNKAINVQPHQLPWDGQ